MNEGISAYERDDSGTRREITLPPSHALSAKFYAVPVADSIEAECPVWVKSGQTPAQHGLPLLGVRQT